MAKTSKSGKSGKYEKSSGDQSLLQELLSQILHSDPFSRFGAHGIGIGFKMKDGKASKKLAIRFHVAYKIPLANLAVAQRIPKKYDYFSEKQGRSLEVLADVIESASPVPLMDPESVVRPVPGGVSCSGHGDLWPGSGTMGGWVWDNTDDSIVMLSNQHVFGNAAGTPVIQPGSADGGVFPNDRIGEVKRSVPLVPAPVPISDATYPDDCNFVDAAIAQLDDSDDFDLTVMDIGPAVYDTTNPVIGMSVEKFGQTTDHTIGVITDFPYHTAFPYPVEGEVIICDCFRYETNDPTQLPLSAQGDSGSLVFEAGPAGDIKPAVGLLFAGGLETNNNWSVACQISNVFSALDLGPLCIAGCAAFVDALYAEDDDLELRHVAAHNFTLKERSRQRSRKFHVGLTLDVQKRFLNSRKGRSVIQFITRNRSELMRLVINDGDMRRALVFALRPMLVGAVTSTDVLSRKFSKDNIERLHKVFDVGREKGSESFAKSIEVLEKLLQGAEGKSLKQLLDIK